MSEKNTGGLAFPVTEQNGVNYPDGGMTLRDYFAAKWMQGFVAYSGPETYEHVTKDEAAKRAYEMADAMLRARGQS